MNCPQCKVELEIFVAGGSEFYVCPVCLSVLLEQASSAKGLKHFCKKELLSSVISTLAEPSAFDKAEPMLKNHAHLACPKCRATMKADAMDVRLKFFVNKCPECGSIWITTMQTPLVAMAFAEDNNERDATFRQAIEGIYQELRSKKRRRPESLDAIIAPYMAVPLSLLGATAGVGAALPVGDNVFRKTGALATTAIIATCVICLFLLLSPEAVLAVALVPDGVLKDREFYRLISYAFAHAGLLHLAGNMWFLWTFGRTVEEKMGIVRFVLLYLACALASAILFMAGAADKAIPCVGASGAVSGVIAAYLILFPKAKLKFCIFAKMWTYTYTTYVYAWIYIIAWAAMNVLFGIFQLAGQASRVAYWGHIGGFVAGVIFAELYKAFTPTPSGPSPSREA